MQSWKLSTRHIQTGYYLEKYFPEKGVRYLSLLDTIDTGVDSAMNDFTPFKAIMNDMYAKDISKKIKSVKQDKVKKGLFIGGKAPFGYIISSEIKNEIVIDIEAAKVVKKIFRLALEGISGRQIAVSLTESGIPTPSEYAGLRLPKKTVYSNHWKAEVIIHMLKNEVYIGNMVQGRMKKISYKSKKCIRLPEEEWVVVENTHEPIIDKETFNMVQLLLEKRRRIKTRTLDYPLKGLLVCRECGVTMGAVPKSGKYYLRCRTYARFTKSGKCTSHSIRADLVEVKVIDRIRMLCKSAFDEEEMKGIIKTEIHHIIKNRIETSQIEELGNRIHTLNLLIDRIYSDKLKSVLTTDDFNRIYEMKKQEKEKVQQKLNELKHNQEKNEGNEQLVERITQDFLEMQKGRQFIFAELIDRIEISDQKEIFIYFRFRPIAQGMKNI